MEQVAEDQSTTTEQSGGVNERKIDHQGTGKSYVKMQPKDCKELLGISRQQFYNDAKAYAWSSERGYKGAVLWHVPLDYFKQRQEEKIVFDQQHPVDENATSIETAVQSSTMSIEEPKPSIDQPVSSSAMSTDAQLSKLEGLYKQLLEEKERLLDDKERHIQVLQQDVEVYKRELENRNFQIMKYREQDKEPSKRWWQFWK